MPATVNCPTCNRLVEWVDAEKFRPFCSERCKLIDLGEWVTGSYAIPGEPGGAHEIAEGGSNGRDDH